MEHIIGFGKFEQAASARGYVQQHGNDVGRIREWIAIGNREEWRRRQNAFPQRMRHQREPASVCSRLSGATALPKTAKRGGHAGGARPNRAAADRAEIVGTLAV